MLLGRTYETTLDLDNAFVIYAMMIGDEVSGEFAQQLSQAGLTSKRFGHLSSPYVALGGVLEQLNLHDVARTQYQRAVDLGDGTSHAPHALGNLLLRDRLYTAARENLQRAYNKQPNRTNAVGVQNGNDLALAMLAQFDIEAASKVFEAGIAAADSSLRSQSIAGSIACLYLAGDFAEAQADAEQAIIDAGATAEMLYLRAITTGANGGDAANVISDLQAAISNQPLQAADSLSALAFFADVAGDALLAEDALARALEQSPNHFYSRYLKAFFAARNGDVEGALTDYESLVRSNPNCAALLAGYASLLSNEGSYVKADVAFSRIDNQLRNQTKSNGGANTWANVYLRQGVNFLQLSRYEQALSAFDYTLALDSQLHAARNARAITTYANDELDIAVAEFSYLQDALRESEEHPQFVYAELWKNRLQEHDKLRRWTDDFSGKRLRPGWDLQDGARAGIAPRHENSSLVIEGQHQSAAITSVSRSVPGIAFRSYAADLVVAPEHRGAAGIGIALKNRSKVTWAFEIERNREGKISYTLSRGTRVEAKNVDLSVAVGSPMRVSFSLNREPKQPVLTVRVNEQVVYEDEVVALRNPTGRMSSSFFARTAHALPVDISYDNVELIYVEMK
jgi:tetratricopeptide (TPR) repeat protein